MMRSRASAEAKAQTLWLQAQEDLINGQTAAAMDLTNSLLDRHGTTASGKRALLLKADILTAQGNLGEAEGFYERAAGELGGDPLLVTSARRGLAVLYENRGDLAAAAAIYEELGLSGHPEGGRLFDLKAAGRCYSAAGDVPKAIAAYEALVDGYGDSHDRVARDYVHLSKVAIAELRHGSAS